MTFIMLIWEHVCEPDLVKVLVFKAFKRQVFKRNRLLGAFIWQPIELIFVSKTVFRK